MQDLELLSEFSTPEEDNPTANKVIEETSLRVRKKGLDFLDQMIMRGNRTYLRFL